MTETEAGSRAFTHAEGVPKQAGTPISSTTRYLAGAAYVDETYADTVIDELVGQSHRAVAPALGYDVVTIVRHCFRAQQLWLRQNAMLTVILLLGAWFFTAATVTLFVVSLGVHFLRSGGGRAHPGKHLNWKVIGGVVVLLIVAGCLFNSLSSLLPLLKTQDSYPSVPYSSVTDGSSDGDLARFVIGLVVVGAAYFVVLLFSRYRMIEIITGDLARGRPSGVRRPEAREVEQRLQVIEAAQGGNILLHAGFEPFVGAGERINAWSTTTELRAVESPGRHGEGASRRVDIDPVALTAHLRKRLAEMRSRDLPQSTRVVGLQLRDQVVSSGTRWHDYPLIDEPVRLPFSFAEPATVDAIIRAPQTSARHFLRATVGAPDRAAVGTDGRTIMPAEHQSVITSTFIHIAVEGGMLYVELVATVLGPIRQRYLDIDRYSAAEDQLTAAAGEAIRRLFDDVAVAPARLVRSIHRRLTLVGAIHRADREARSEPVYDFGSRLDVRQLASRADFANYLQRLDAEKYTRLIDRRATEAIHEFLAANGVDDSEFVNTVNFHQYNNTEIGGNAYGPIATGSGATATMSGVTVSASAVTKSKGSGT